MMVYTSTIFDVRTFWDNSITIHFSLTQYLMASVFGSMISPVPSRVKNPHTIIGLYNFGKKNIYKKVSST